MAQEAFPTSEQTHLPLGEPASAGDEYVHLQLTGRGQDEVRFRRPADARATVR